MTIDRFQIRRDLDLLEQAMQQERFIKDSDPSVSVLAFIEDVANVMGAIKHLYQSGARDRNNIVNPMKKKLSELRATIDAMEDNLSKAVEDPEDTNSALPKDADESVEDESDY